MSDFELESSDWMPDHDSSTSFGWLTVWEPNCMPAWRSSIISDQLRNADCGLRNGELARIEAEAESRMKAVGRNIVAVKPWFWRIGKASVKKSLKPSSKVIATEG